MAFLGSVGSWIANNLMGIANIGTSAAAGVMSMQGVKDTNAANQAMAREQMGFQREMSNTSYQRAMADMKQAGLNPMLAFQQGGASTPGGASSTAQNALGAGVSSAMEARRMIADLKNLQAQNENLRAQKSNFEKQNSLIDHDIVFRKAQAGLANAQENATRSGTVLDLVNKHMNAMESSARCVKTEAETDRVRAETNKVLEEIVGKKHGKASWLFGTDATRKVVAAGRSKRKWESPPHVKNFLNWFK